MSEKLYRTADRDAVTRLRAAGARVLFQFPGGVVLSEPPAGDVEGVTEVDPSRVAVGAQPTAETFGEAAYALRLRPDWRARKAQRPHVDLSMDQIIAGTADEIP